MHLSEKVENIVGKGENTGSAFSPFPSTSPKGLIYNHGHLNSLLSDKELTLSLICQLWALPIQQHKKDMMSEKWIQGPKNFRIHTRPPTILRSSYS